MGIKNYIDEKGFWSEATSNDGTNTCISGAVQFSGEIFPSGFADLPLLLFLVDVGPFEAYSSGMFHEIQYENRVFPKTRTWYTNSLKSKKIIEQNIEYNSRKTPSQITWKVYEKDGVTVKRTAIDIISYIPGTIFELTRQRFVS